MPNNPLDYRGSINAECPDCGPVIGDWFDYELYCGKCEKVIRSV